MELVEVERDFESTHLVVQPIYSREKKSPSRRRYKSSKKRVCIAVKRSMDGFVFNRPSSYAGKGYEEPSRFGP